VLEGVASRLGSEIVVSFGDNIIHGDNQPGHSVDGTEALL
jgi:hypothetical protein